MKASGRLALLALLLAAPAAALEFRSTAKATILYNAPSREADKIAVTSAGVPFEVFVETQNWDKVRDYTGRLGWLEKSALGDARTVLVTADEAAARQRPEPGAEPVFRVARGVILRVDDASRNGWLKVRHATGGTGWLPQSEVWGE